ncbi:MAG: diguanylate cyclase [Cyanobacteriota bacterium]
MRSTHPMRLQSLPVQALLLAGAVLAAGGLASWQLQRHLSQRLMHQALQAERLQVQEDVAQFDATLADAEQSVLVFAGLISAIDTRGAQAMPATGWFPRLVQRDGDGVWRSRSGDFQPARQAGIWIPPYVDLSASTRSFFSQAQPITTVFGLGVSSGPLENTWVLPLGGGEVIFWPPKPDFIREARADLDYRLTPWVQLTSPVRNPQGRPRWTRPSYDPAAREWLISVVAPFRQNGSWAGSVGHDLVVRHLLRWLVPPGRDQGGGLMAQPLYVVAADGRLLVQAGRQTLGEDRRLPAAHRRVLESPRDGARVFTLNLGPEHLIVARLPRLDARVVYRVDGAAIQALVSRELRGLQLAVTLFMLLLLLLGLLLVGREIRFRRREQALLEERNRDLAQQVEARTRELAEANRELALLASQDGLTGVGNRRLFEQELARTWAYSRRRQEPLALVMADVDHFKLLNDSLGHPAGDACLRAVAAVLQAGVHRPEDGVFRYGGEEFVLLLANTDAHGALVCAEQLRQALLARALPHPRGSVSASFGVASTVPAIESGDSEALLLLQAADTALYEAKQQGRNRVVQGVSPQRPGA